MLFQPGLFLYNINMKKKIILALVLFIVASSLMAYTPLDKNKVNSFDRSFMIEYNPSLDKAATVADISLFATPLVTAFSGEKRLGTVTVMYAETFLLSWGAKEILKHIVSRDRPYLYYENPPVEKEDDWHKSFPSGHTTLAFATAAFTAYTFSEYNPESSWRIPVTAGVYSLAFTTAALRILSGSHFMTDVIAGATLGSLIGFAIPWLHTLSDDVKMGVTPFSLAFNIKF